MSQKWKPDSRRYVPPAGACWEEGTSRRAPIEKYEVSLSPPGPPLSRVTQTHTPDPPADVIEVSPRRGYRRLTTLLAPPAFAQCRYTQRRAPLSPCCLARRAMIRSRGPPFMSSSWNPSVAASRQGLVFGPLHWVSGWEAWGGRGFRGRSGRALARSETAGGRTGSGRGECHGAGPRGRRPPLLWLCSETGRCSVTDIR